MSVVCQTCVPVTEGKIIWCKIHFSFPSKIVTKEANKSHASFNAACNIYQEKSRGTKLLFLNAGKNKLQMQWNSFFNGLPS